MTVRRIEADGFRPAARVNLRIRGEAPVDVADYAARGVSGLTRAFARLKPDVVVLLGDRYEILAAAEAALFLGIPVAHLHGGEATEGANDEAMRHAVTKMAHLHFAAAEPYRRRIIQLGEQPSRVFNVGAVGLESVARLELLSRTELESALGLPLVRPLLAVTYHPATLSDTSPLESVRRLFAALERFPEATVVFTYANADAYGQSINRAIDAFVRRRPARAKAFASLGQLRYLSLLKHCDAVVGNSSSGVIEAPTLRAATVNIGERQGGRLRAPSVIDCADTPAAIAAALRKALDPAWRRRALRGLSPYRAPGSPSRRIAAVLRKADLGALRVKRFHDLGGRR